MNYVKIYDNLYILTYNMSAYIYIYIYIYYTKKEVYKLSFKNWIRGQIAFKDVTVKLTLNIVVLVAGSVW